MPLFLTYLLALPYIVISLYFLSFKGDAFFQKQRTSIQLLFVLWLLGLLFVNLILWKLFFSDYFFLGVSIQIPVNMPTKMTAFVAVLATIAAVFGWIFTSRIQVVSASKTHSMQVLMNSRNSAAYTEKVEVVMRLRREFLAEQASKKLNRNTFFFKKNIPKTAQLNKVKMTTLPIKKYNSLCEKDKSAIHYMLNYLEFIAVGIRHNNLDESLIKASLFSILNGNIEFFNEVIVSQRKTSKTTYSELMGLNERWQIQSKAVTEKFKIFGLWAIDKKKVWFVVLMVVPFFFIIQICNILFNMKKASV